MIHNIEALWQETSEADLRISFPGTSEPEMIIPAGKWQRDDNFKSAKPARPHLRLVH